MRIGSFGRRAALGIGLAGVLALGGASFASARGPGGHHGPGKGFARALGSLDLDDAQRNSIQALMEQAREAHQQGREAMRSERERLHALLDAESPDRNAVLEQAEVIGELATERRKAHLETLLAVRGELTDDQWSELRAAMKERHEKRRFMRRHDRRGGDAPETGDLF